MEVPFYFNINSIYFAYIVVIFICFQILSFDILRWSKRFTALLCVLKFFNDILSCNSIGWEIQVKTWCKKRRYEMWLALLWLLNNNFAEQKLDVEKIWCCCTHQFMNLSWYLQVLVWRICLLTWFLLCRWKKRQR